MPVSTWQAVLGEVRQQAAQADKEDTNLNGSGFDIAEDLPTTAAQKHATLRWQQQQWQNAFEVLV